MDTATTLQSLKAWPVSERFELLCGLWDQLIDDGWQPTVDEKLAAELDRRWSSFKMHPESGFTPEQMRESIRRLP